MLDDAQKAFEEENKFSKVVAIHWCIFLRSFIFDLELFNFVTVYQYFINTAAESSCTCIWIFFCIFLIVISGCRIRMLRNCR